MSGLSSNEKHNVIHKSERHHIQRKYFNQGTISNFKILEKLFPRRINKNKFRKILAKLKLNKVY